MNTGIGRGAHSRGLLGLLRSVIKHDVARLGLVTLLGSSLAVMLGMAYPIQREIEMGAYRYAQYDVRAETAIPGSLEPSLSGALGSRGCIGSGWHTRLSRGERVVDDTALMVLAPSCTTALTAFPPETLMTSVAVAGDQWIDLSADGAKALGAGAGDQVDLMTAPDVPALTLTVRGIYAVRGAAPLDAQASAAAVFAAIPGTAEENYSTIFVRAMSKDELMALLSQDAYRPALEAAKFFPPAMADRAELQSYAEKNAATSLGLVRVIGILAVLGAVGLAIRELDVFRRRLVPSMRLAHDLGAPTARLVLLAHLAAAAVSAVAIVLGAAVGSLVFTTRLLSPGIPNSQARLLVGLVVAAITVALAAGLTMARMVDREVVG